MKQDVWQTKEVRKHAIEKLAQIEEEEEIAKTMDIMNLNFETGKIEREKVTVDQAAFRQDAVDFMQRQNNKAGADKKIVEEENTKKDYEMDEKLEEKEQQILTGVKQAYQDKIAKMRGVDNIGAGIFFFKGK